MLVFETKSVRLCSPVAFWGLVYKHHQHGLCLWEVLVAAQTHAKSDGEDCRKAREPAEMTYVSQIAHRIPTKCEQCQFSGGDPCKTPGMPVDILRKICLT